MAGSFTAKLTARTVAAIKPNGDDFDVRDSELRGFHVRVTKRGEMVYRFQYRRPDGSRPVLTLGKVSELTPDQARKAANAQFIAVGGGAEANITRGVLHSFRHTFLTRLAESGASAIDIRNTAGHADIATSMKYVHAAENARLRELQEQNSKGIREAMKKRPVNAEVRQFPGKAETA